MFTVQIIRQTVFDNELWLRRPTWMLGNANWNIVRQFDNFHAISSKKFHEEAIDYEV